MNSWLRGRWPMVVGFALVAVVLAAGIAGGNREWFDGGFLGVDEAVWGLACFVLAAALAGQLLLTSREAFQRERRLVHTAAQLRETSAELDRLARTDPLTGVPNRRAFFDLLGVEFRRSRRYARDLSVLMLDLDHFKQVNDRWGHPFGDVVLQQIAATLAGNIRESDILGRYGGEEFVLALPETAPAQAVVVAEKLRLAVQDIEVRDGQTPPADEPPVRITISIGVAALPVEDDQDESELIRRADQALYEAKRTGRNRVTVFTKEEVRPPAIEESDIPLSETA